MGRINSLRALMNELDSSSVDTELDSDSVDHHQRSAIPSSHDNNINWIDTTRIKNEGMQIMNVCFDLFASNQVFNDVYRLLMSYHLIRSSMFGK